MVTAAFSPADSLDEMSLIHADLLRDLHEVMTIGPANEASLLNDDYYLQIAFQLGDLDKMRVYKALFVTFRGNLHLVESVVDILRDDLGHAEVSPVITKEMVESYRIVVDSFKGLGGIPQGAIARATVRAVEEPAQAKALAVSIRQKQYV